MTQNHFLYPQHGKRKTEEIKCRAVTWDKNGNNKNVLCFIIIVFDVSRMSLVKDIVSCLW